MVVPVLWGGSASSICRLKGDEKPGGPDMSTAMFQTGWLGWSEPKQHPLAQGLWACYWHEKGIQCDAYEWNGPVFPGPFIAQGIMSPLDFLTSFDHTRLVIFHDSPLSSLHLYGYLVCPNHAVLMMLGFPSSWKSGRLGHLKYALLSEEFMDTLEGLLCFQTHLGFLECTCL